MRNMFTKKSLLFSAIAVTAVMGNDVKAQFTTGNVVVLQVGNGVSTLSNVAAPLFLKEYNTTMASQTTAVSMVAIPPSGTGGARLTNSGSASSEGQITLSADSTKIVIAGYDADTATTGVASTTSLAVPRAIDTVGKLGIPGRADTSQSAFTGNNIRSATRGSTENYWAAGGNTGTYYMGNLATPTVIQSATASNTRVILAANGKLYFTTSSGTPRFLRINSQPTTATVADTLITLGIGASPYGFAINSSESVIYIADDRTTSAGGIQKWTLNGTTWSLTYTLNVGSGLGARSVIADWSTTAPTLYAVTTAIGGSLVKMVDSNATAVPLTLATGTATAIIRSVAFVPRAVFTCVPATLATSATPYTCASNGTITLSATLGTGPFTFAYTGPSSFTSTAQNLTNLQPGTYNVTVTATGGCTSSTSVTVANNATITASAAATGSTTRCAKDSVLLTANAGTGYRYQWKLNGVNLLPTDTMQTYKAGASGNYTVAVSSGVNCTATSSAIAVTINPQPSAMLTASGSTTFCTGGSVQLCAPAGTGYTYQFRNASGNITGATSQCYTASTSGAYKAIVTTALGCTDSTASGTVVTVGAPPTATITPAGTVNICAGYFVKLRTNSAPGLTYSWKRNGITITGAGATDSTLIVSIAGIYSVTVSTGPLCTATSLNDTVVVNPLPQTGVMIISPLSLCAGDTVKARATGGAGNLYSWSVAGVGTTPQGPDSAFSIATPTGITIATGYSFRAIVTNAAGCKDSSLLQTVTVNPLPTPVIVNSGGFLDAGSYASYQWYRNGVLMPGITGSLYTPTQDGTYTVRVTNAAGCSATSAGVVIAGLAVSNTLLEHGIHIFPNPVEDVLNIAAPVAVNAVIKDMQGREVMRVANVKTLHTVALSTGVYSISIYNADGLLIGTQAILKR